MSFAVGLSIRELVGHSVGHDVGHGVGRHGDLKYQMAKPIGREDSLICEALNPLNKLNEGLGM